MSDYAQVKRIIQCFSHELILEFPSVTAFFFIIVNQLNALVV